MDVPKKSDFEKINIEEKYKLPNSGPNVAIILAVGILVILLAGIAQILYWNITSEKDEELEKDKSVDIIDELSTKDDLDNNIKKKLSIVITSPKNDKTVEDGSVVNVSWDTGSISGSVGISFCPKEVFTPEGEICRMDATYLNTGNAEIKLVGAQSLSHGWWHAYIVDQNDRSKYAFSQESFLVGKDVYSEGYGLFIERDQDKADAFIPEIKYFDYGTIASGVYAGYNRIVAMRTYNGEGYNPGYSFLITKDYVDYEVDKEGQNIDIFNNSKVTEAEYEIPLEHPVEIVAGNFVLIRMGMNQTPVENKKELNSLIPGLRFFSEPILNNSSASGYIDGNGIVKVESKEGIIFDYRLVSKESYVRYEKNKDNNTYFNEPFYIKSELGSNFSSYDSYNTLMPGACGGSYISVLKNISNSDVFKIGTTLNGTDIYILNGFDHPINKGEYFSKVESIPGDMFSTNHPRPSYSEYMVKYPVLLAKDPWGRFIALGEFEYLLPGGCGKPVIYLYPEKPTKVSVKLDESVKFSTDIPTYAYQWRVLAHPDGSLTDLQPEYTDCNNIDSKKRGSEYASSACKSRVYPYLYWSGQVNRIYPDIKSGWVFAKEDLILNLEQKLKEVGLNEKEISDMLDYWIPELLEKNAPYYRIILFQNADMNNFIPLNINPKPDTTIRVFLDWEPLSKSIDIQPETLYHINRKGFTVVEWGGIKR